MEGFRCQERRESVGSATVPTLFCNTRCPETGGHKGPPYFSVHPAVQPDT